MPDPWLIATSLDGQRQYVVHTERPRFTVEIVEGDESIAVGEIVAIDEVPLQDVAVLRLKAGKVYYEHARMIDQAVSQSVGGVRIQ